MVNGSIKTIVHQVNNRRELDYSGRILKGENLPICRSELVINLKTAKALDAIDADEVILGCGTDN
jgi:hypothetical protein